MTFKIVIPIRRAAQWAPPEYRGMTGVYTKDLLKISPAAIRTSSSGAGNYFDYGQQLSTNDDPGAPDPLSWYR